MSMTESKFIKSTGIWLKRELNIIKKKDNFYLQPIFEAFTNALEAIDILRDKHPNQIKENGEITISISLAKNLLSDQTKSFDLEKIEIEDSGIGFEDGEFERFINLRDDRKGFLNRGTGRIQFLHAFDKTTFESNYRKADSKEDFSHRKFTFSKCQAFMEQNAIIRLDEEKDIEVSSSSTKVTFETLLNDKDINHFKTISALEVKEELIRHYLAGFCEKRDRLPLIKIKLIVENEIKENSEILPQDIPTPDREENIEIHYSKFVDNKLTKSGEYKLFNLKAFIIPESDLDKNALKLVSKGEIATSITLENLLPADTINGKRYLFLLSGKYIDERDSDTRGNIKLYNKEDFKKNAESSLFEEEEILLEDIEEKTNQTIMNFYKEIEDKRKEKDESIKELKEMFLLSDKTIDSLRKKIKIGDSDDEILKKIYKAEANTIAKRDADIKKQVKELETLEPTEKDYQEKLKKQVNDFVKIVPLQNRTALTQYVARRKVVLDLFDKILKKEIEKLKNGERIDEDLMHNLIFQQHSDDPDNSDLWLINEEFIYFDGTSEYQLDKVEINGIKLFKDEFGKEVAEYLNSLGEKRLTKRPDVLLFPPEGKCIIIEFKAPEVNVAEHLTQIDFYANLIRNYTVDEYQITTFYGYLIGESIQDRDVRGRVSRFEHSYHLDYWFRPSEPVNGFDGRSNGSIYTEVVKYSTLLERARLRNHIFIEKIEKNNK